MEHVRWLTVEFKKYVYHVTFGAGNASHVSDNVPLCPRSTLMSVKDCVMLSGAKIDNKMVDRNLMSVLLSLNKVQGEV